jgi:hypothetical protein
MLRHLDLLPAIAPAPLLHVLMALHRCLLHLSRLQDKSGHLTIHPLVWHECLLLYVFGFGWDTNTNVADKEDKVQPDEAEETKQDQRNNEAAEEIVATDDKDKTADEDKGANNDKAVDRDEEETEAKEQEDEEGEQQEDNQDKKKQDKKGAKSKKISAVSQRTEFGPVSIH